MKDEISDLEFCRQSIPFIPEVRSVGNGRAFILPSRLVWYKEHAQRAEHERDIEQDFQRIAREMRWLEEEKANMSTGSFMLEQARIRQRMKALKQRLRRRF